MKLEFLEAGEIVTTHGVRGEVKIQTIIFLSSLSKPLCRSLI